MSKVTAQIIGGNPKAKRVESDFYPTPPEVTQVLLDFLKIPKESFIWEPACGDGHMVEVMKENGYVVHGTDIQNGTDFLEVKETTADWIITNPPFSLADEFVEHCAKLRVPFALLLKSQYWHARKRNDLFYKYPPRYILPLTWRPDFLFHKRADGERAAPLMDVMWCVWNGKSTITQYIPLLKPEMVGGAK